MKINSKYFVLIIFLLTLAFRLYLTFSASNFSDESAYFYLRHIENIIEDKKIIFYDELSYGGRYVLQPPLFNIIMAFLSFGNEYLLKIIPEIFFSFIVIVIYFIAKEISYDETSALFSSLISGFIPIFIQNTINRISPYSLAIPILLLMFYCLLKIEKKFFRNLFIVLSFILPLIHPIAILFILGYCFYILILSGGAITSTKAKKEAALFAVVIIILIELIVYKKALFTYGANVIWQNIPINILEDSYRVFSIKELLLGIGIIPLILGSIGIYFGVNDKNKFSYMYSGLALGLLVLLTFRLITINIGLMLLGITLSIFSGITITNIKNYFKRTKFNIFNYFFVFVFLILFFLLSVFPSHIIPNNINDEKIKDMIWLKENTDDGDVILGNLYEGNLISNIAQRKNVVDTNFLLAPNPVKRLKDVDLIYTTFTEVKVLENIKKYNIKVIYLSKDTKKMYGIKDLKFVKGSKCFDWRTGFYVYKC